LVEHEWSDKLEWLGLGPKKTALVTSSLLAGVPGEPTEIVGIFFDTSDYTTQDLGLAGAQGAISSNQEKAIEAITSQHTRARFIFFLHHPVEELSGSARKRLDAIAEPLAERLL